MSRDALPTALRRTRRQCRILLLLEAAERAGIAPIESQRFHAFAYLADVLAPVWQLLPFDGLVLKSEGGPHFPDIQRDLDSLVIAGLVEIEDIQYVERPNGSRIEARYGLNFASSHLPALLAALGASGAESSFDQNDAETHAYFVRLAQALATLPNDEIDRAAAVDATYSDRRIDTLNLVLFDQADSSSKRSNLTLEVTERFKDFLPSDAHISPGERLYLYASYLGNRANV